MFSRKKKFFVLSIALLCVSCLIFTGCGRNDNNTNNQNPPATNNQTDNQTNGTDGMNGNNMDNTSSNLNGNNAADTNPTSRTADNNTAGDNDLHQRAEKIAKAVTSDIAQVKDSRVVISERMAYVSVEIDKTADTAESATLKDEISNVVKKTDTEIETVYVMEDADTFTRMKEIGEDIAEGKPVSGFLEELQNMFVRVTPSPQ